MFEIEPYTLMVEYLKSKESALKLQGDYIQVVSTKECRNAIENLLKEIEVLRSDLKDCQEKAKSYDMLINDIKLYGKKTNSWDLDLLNETFGEIEIPRFLLNKYTK